MTNPHQTAQRQGMKRLCQCSQQDSESECYIVINTNHSVLKNATMMVMFTELPSQAKAENM